MSIVFLNRITIFAKNTIMKKLILIFNICFIFVAFAQKPYKVETSNEIELQNKSYADNIIAYGTNSVCMVSSKNSGFMGYKAPKVEDTKFNFFNGSTFKKTVDLIPQDKSAVFMESYNNNGKLAYIDALYNNTKKEVETYYREVSDNGTVTKSTLMNNVVAAQVFLNAPETIFKTVQSPNSKKILNIVIYKDKEKETEYLLGFDNRFYAVYKQNSMKVGVIDENGSLLFKKNISINAPEECDRISIEDYKINDNGDIFLMVKQFIKGKKEKVGGEVNYKLYIYAITNNGTSSKKYAINTKEYFCKRPGLVVANTGNVYCAGFLSEKVSGNLVGFFTQKLGSDLNEAEYKINKITNEDILKYNSKFKYKGDEISENFVIDYIVETDNAVHISAEYFNVITRTSTNGTTTTTYLYFDILYFELNKDLQLKQIYAIPKYQKATSPFFLGYKLIIHNNQPYFIFNDNKNNLLCGLT
jgi:hypothetical protein